MKITKIKLEDIKTEVHYIECIGNTEQTTKVKCSKERDPNFTRQAELFVPFIIETLGLPDDWKYPDNTLMHSIKLDYNETGMGVVFEIARRLSNFNSGIIIKTPRYQENPDKPSSAASILPADTAHHLYRLCELAQDFVRGKRAERDMFEGGQ